MVLEMTAQNGMMTDFTCLVADSTLGEALSHLQEAAYPYGVILDAADVPLGLVIAEDLERAVGRAGEEGADLASAQALRFLPPLLMVTGEARLSAIVRTYQMTLMRHGARGLVVTKDNRAIGVLTHETLSRYLAEGYRPAGGTMSFLLLLPSTLPGPHETPAGTVVCARCNTRNEIEFLDPDNLPWCANIQEPEPGLHRLELGWL